MNEQQRQEMVEEAKARIKRNGGRIGHKLNKINGHKIKTVSTPRAPGIKVLGAVDCLVNYDGYIYLN